MTVIIIPKTIIQANTVLLADLFESLHGEVLTLILTLISISVVLLTLVIIVVVRRRKMAEEMELQRQENERSNAELEKLNRDLQDQKALIEEELAESEMLYRIMLASAGDGIIFYNTDWSVRFANPAVYNMVGYDYNAEDTPDIIRDSELLHPDHQNFHAERSKAISEEGSYETELKLKHTNGKYIVLSTKMVEAKGSSDNTLGILMIARDITSLKYTQSQLITAKEKAEESNRLKSTFLANISHEIRTPLNSIVGFANLLNDDSSDSAMREEYIGYLNQNTEKLLQVITDIIDLSRLENNEIEIKYKPVRINSVLDFADKYTRDLISRCDKKIDFVLRKGLADDRDIVYSDEVWLKRVLRHMLDNAVKFTRSGSVELSAALAGSSIMFTVKDTGIGISKENLKNIFEQFRQEEIGHHRTFEGLGIGLTMARKVVDNMDGYLWVESEKGKGSEFFFTIPYRPVDKSSYNGATEKKKPEVLIKQDWSEKTILVADDNIDILRYLNRVLSNTGINVIQARSGLEAIDIVRDNRNIDLVLLDMQMPEMNGLEALGEIRKIKAGMPIVAQTAFIFEEEQDDLLKAGCDACLIKPISRDQLLSVISGYLNTN